MVNHKFFPSVLGIGLVLSASRPCEAMAPRPVPPPVPMTFVRAETVPETGTLAIEWIVPKVEAVGPLDRLEMLILNAKGDAVFGALQNLSDRCDPVPPGAFGVVLDPARDDRSIQNIASAGQNGQWDQKTPRGTLLQQSASGITAGNLGIAFWIVPEDWNPGRHLILARAVRKKSLPEPWRTLATLDVADDGMTVIPEWGIVKPVFQVVGKDAPMSLESLGSVTLIRYERRPQAEGVAMKRWTGDVSGDVQHVEVDRRELNAADLPEGSLSLPPGFYRFKHLSASGDPPTGFYGESPVFEVRPESQSVEIQIRLHPAI